MSDYRPQAVPVSAEDRARMARLREEISGRLLEMGMIVARTLGESPDGAVELAFRHDLRGKAESDDERRGGPLVGIHFSSCSWGCYEDPPGVCYPCPSITLIP